MMMKQQKRVSEEQGIFLALGAIMLIAAIGIHHMVLTALGAILLAGAYVMK